MNLERGNANQVLITGRQQAENYLLRFSCIDDEVVRMCNTVNSGSPSGPLLLAFEEVEGTPGEGQVTLPVGDHKLEVYEEVDGMEEGDPDYISVEDKFYHRIWSELTRVDDGG